MKKFVLAGLTTILATIMLAGCALVPQENALVEVPGGDLPDDIGLELPIIELDTKLALTYEKDSILVSLATGETEEFLPEGYTIPDQHNYGQGPSFIIARKDNKLYEYMPTQKEFGEIELEVELTEDEIIRVWPSITEKHKFYMEIQTIKPLDGMMPYEVIQSVHIYYDANENELIYSGDMGTQSSPIIFENRGCLIYDSNYERFFSWYCGEGAGSAAPLTVWEIDALETETILDADIMNGDIVPIRYNNGYLYANIVLEKEPGYPEDAIQIFDLTDKNLESEVLVYGKAFQAEDMKIRPFSYSITHVPKKGLIIHGLADGIELLTYDERGIIMEAQKLDIPELYANFVFVEKDFLFVQGSDGIYVINLDTPKVNKPVPFLFGFNEEMTIFNL